MKVVTIKRENQYKAVKNGYTLKKKDLQYWKNKYNIGKNKLGFLKCPSCKGNRGTYWGNNNFIRCNTCKGTGAFIITADYDKYVKKEPVEE